ncbi:MAG: SUMF1/EgtB/PvdO family nonheme iron enzyme, partial [Pseudomonadales bacterium]|nr:SUMF1/EgtB/PvdO family nonheme iron enzyme [Pseudomonadales bacterium]
MATGSSSTRPRRQAGSQGRSQTRPKIPGDFPRHDSGNDGYTGTCPVKAFPANNFGMYNMTGNVWEMCGDWFGPPQNGRLPAGNPTGPPDGDTKVLKGGSFLCHR